MAALLFLLLNESLLTSGHEQTQSDLFNEHAKERILNFFGIKKKTKTKKQS